MRDVSKVHIQRRFDLFHYNPGERNVRSHDDAEVKRVCQGSIVFLLGCWESRTGPDCVTRLGVRT
jgi:hypothetical protein